MSHQEQNYAIYLSYANEVKKADLVVAIYCKIYYAQQVIGLKRQIGSVVFQKEESATINSVIKEIEQGQAALGKEMKKEQKQQRVESYCTRMYQKIMAEASNPNCNRGECIDRLKTVSDFIDILTVFVPLNAEWTAKSTHLVCLIIPS